MDTIEDNNERIHSMSLSEICIKDGSPKKKLTPVHSCPVCKYDFRDLDEFHRHLYTHTKESVFFKVNDYQLLTMQRRELLVNQLYALDLVIVNSSESVTLEICEGSICHYYGQVKDGGSLMTLLPSGVNNNIKLTLTSQDGCHDYLIRIRQQIEFSSQTLDELAFETLFKPLDERNEIKSSQFKSALQFEFSHFSEIEHNYAKGLYAYARGYYQLLQNDYENASRHLPEALSRLAYYRTPFAVTAVRALGLHMNRFNLLEGTTDESPFAVAHYFFNPHFYPDTRFDYPRECHAVSVKNYGIYIDGFTIGLLGVLSAYYSRQWPLFNWMIRFLKKEYHSKDIAQEHKILLLEARAAYLNQDVNLCLKKYFLIEGELEFQREAKEMREKHVSK